MLGFIKKLFGAKPVETVEEAPYKVEAPVSQPSAVVEKATEAVVKSVAPAKKTAAKKAGAAKRGPKKPKAKAVAK